MQLKFNEKIENTNIGTICYNNLYKNAAVPNGAELDVCNYPKRNQIAD